MTKQFVVRAPPELVTLVHKVARARGEYTADLVRRAVKTELAKLSFSSEFEKKALGIQNDEPTALGKRRKTKAG